MGLFKKGNKNLPTRYRENAKGDFYVVNDACITCGAPQAEAPDLIDHSRLQYGHCFFKKQPETAEETDQAINALAVSCISGIRYGGKDEQILKRLYQMGEAEQCDHAPVGNYKLVIWNKVKFTYTGTIDQLSENISSQAIFNTYFPNHKIVHLKTGHTNSFEFACRWTDGLTGILYQCNAIDQKHVIQLDKETNGYFQHIRAHAVLLNIVLCNDKNVSKIVWFDTEGNAYQSSEIK